MSFFGANIYPENITVALEQPQISEWVTGKFFLEVTEETDQNRHSTITVELAPGETDNPDRVALLAESVRTRLRAGSTVNSRTMGRSGSKPHKSHFARPATPSTSRSA